ncbi:MAG TPA: hypothetical protein VG276_28695 [Actinomycetes bacterium]|nr:hypothetical protein [Actinomycetes bacterium]
MASRGSGNEVEIVVKTKDETKGTGQRIKRELIRQGGEAGKGYGRSFGTGLKGSLSGAVGVAKVLGKGLLLAGGGVAALAAGAVIAGPKLASMSARLKDLDAKAQAVFVGELPKVRRWAEANKRALGLSSRETVGLAANLADLLKPIGFTAREATNMSLRFLDLAGALSKWSGGTRSAAEVSDILAAAVLGEREQLKELGIAISEADVQARLAAKGQQDLTGAALQQAEAVATQELIYAKSTDAQKAWAEGGRQAAIAQKSLSSTIAELKEKLVTALTPAIQTATAWLGRNLPVVLQAATTWWDKNKTSVQTLADALTVLFVPAAGSASKSTDGVTSSLKRLQNLFSGVMVVILRIVQGFLLVALAAGNVRKWILNLGIAAGMLINAIDRLSGGSGHAADGMVRDFRRMRDEGESQLARIREQIRATQREIDRLHGKTVDIRIRVRGAGGGTKTMLPGYQHGTASAPGGTAIVGERGPELVDLPRGARVTPMHRMAGGGGTIINMTVNVAPTAHPAEVGSEIVQAIRAYERRNSNTWRTGPRG